jgi:hypothetical protein
MECITALATIVIAIFTGLLWCSTKKLWKTTTNSIKLANDEIELTKQEFVVSHPPKLRVHSVALILSYASENSFGTPTKIQFFIDNIGGSNATISRDNLTFTKLGTPLPVLLPFSSEFHRLPAEILKPGEGTTGLLCLDAETDNSLNEQWWEPPDDHASDFYFFGYIDYLDNIGTTRRIAFCRQFNPTTRRFTAVKDDDYEYSY